jgi:hypothetical protein
MGGAGGAVAAPADGCGPVAEEVCGLVADLEHK